jgi:hypothetical protein
MKNWPKCKILNKLWPYNRKCFISAVNINSHGREGLKFHKELFNVQSSASIFNADQGKSVTLRKLWSLAGNLGLQVEFCWERSRSVVNETRNVIDIKRDSGEPNFESWRRYSLTWWQFFVVFSVPLGRSRNITWIEPRSLPFRSFPILKSWVILSSGSSCPRYWKR